jgi:hypothetical protein
MDLLYRGRPIWTQILEKRNSTEKDDNLPQLTLDEFAKRNIAIEMFSEILGSNVWLCSNEEMANQIKRDIPDAVCYTSDELRDLLNLYPTPEDIRKLNLVKGQFNNSKIIFSIITPKSQNIREIKEPYEQQQRPD